MDKLTQTYLGTLAFVGACIGAHFGLQEARKFEYLHDRVMIYAVCPFIGATVGFSTGILAPLILPAWGITGVVYRKDRFNSLKNGPQSICCMHISLHLSLPSLALI